MKRGRKKKKECNIQGGIWGKRIFLRQRNWWLLEQGKKVAKNNGKSKTQGIKFTQEKAGENKENEKIRKTETKCRRTDKQERQKTAHLDREKG